MEVAYIFKLRALGRGHGYSGTKKGGRTTPRDMGLGSAADVPLADAREKAADARKMLSDGIDPIEHRKTARADHALDVAKAVTFETCADAYVAAHRAGWRNAKHSWQWAATLKAHAYPTLGKLPVGEIDVGLVLKVLEPIWKTKTETASRLRGRIENVLDWARVRGYHQGDNPARWRGNLDHLLPKRSKVQKVTHHPALPYAQVGAFVSDIRKQGGTAARALEFVILTATRTSEAIGAQWHEIDLDAALWTVPADRIKGGKEHRVPLSAPALALIKAQAKTKNGEFVFLGLKRGKPLSNMALLALLKRIGRDDLTVHGFRSTFRDWAAEQTNYAGDVAEMALAHVVSDKVEAAYRRGDMFEKRRRLMADWAKYCSTVV